MERKKSLNIAALSDMSINGLTTTFSSPNFVHLYGLRVIHPGEYFQTGTIDWNLGAPPLSGQHAPNSTDSPRGLVLLRP